MDFEAEEVVRLREEILRFVLQQLKESAASGELRQASEELIGPIASAVEAAVKRAMPQAGAAGAANARIGDLEINRIARAVANQLGGKTRAKSSSPQGDVGVIQDTAQPDEPWDIGRGDPDPAEGPRRRRPGSALEQWIGYGLALVLGVAIGVGLAKFMAAPDPSLVGSEAAQIVTETQPVATSDSQLREVEAPTRAPAAAVPTQGSSTAPR